MNNKKTFLFSFVSVILCMALAGSNLVWYKLYTREKQKIKNAVIPTFSEDYFTSQLNAVKDIAEWPEDYEPDYNEHISAKYYDDKDIYILKDEYAEQYAKCLMINILKS